MATGKGKGKPCGASYISKNKVCRLSLPPEVAKALNAVSGQVGDLTLYKAVRAYGGKEGVKGFNQVKRDLKAELGKGNIVKGPKADEFKRRLQAAGLLPAGKKVSAGELTKANEKLNEIVKEGVKAMQAGKQTSFNRLLKEQELAKEKVELAKLKKERQKLVDEGEQLKAEGGHVKRRAEIVAEIAKIDVKLQKPDISAMAKPASVRKEPGPTNFHSQLRILASEDARKFDESFVPLKSIKGTADMIDWGETVKNGKKIGEGSFGTVMLDPKKDYVVKRGEVSSTEAALIKKLGEADLGPKLLKGELGEERRDGGGIHKGRIAMTLVPGEPLGWKEPYDTVGGVKLADAYWTARAKLHRLGIAHNDMHVTNVLVDDKGKGRFVDMGLSQESPKAALSEALGFFGKGDWQSSRWNATGGRLFEKVLKAERTRDPEEEVRKALKDVEEKAPVMRKVIGNLGSLRRKLEEDGFTTSQIKQLRNTAIRSSLSSYEKGVWKAMTDKKAMEYIEILYEGV